MVRVSLGQIKDMVRCILRGGEEEEKALLTSTPHSTDKPILVRSVLD